MKKTLLKCSKVKELIILGRYLISEDVHDEGEDGDELEEDERAADDHEGVVQVEVVQKVLKK
jgi:hypothetical protein